MRFSHPAAALAVVLAAALTTGGAGSPAIGGTGNSAYVGQRHSPGTIDGWRTRSPRALGLRASVLRSGARDARSLDSTCFAVIRDGKLARDWNWTMKRTVPRPVFSITKSVTSTLVGIAIRDGDLRLDDRVSTYVPQWRGTASEEVTVRNLLSNDSGRFWSLQSDYRDLRAARNRTRYAIGLPQQYPPGSAWAYNTAAIQVLEPVLEQATGMPVARFARKRLFEPLGMTHTTFVTDRLDNSPQAFFGVWTTCLDLARLGMLYLDKGVVDDVRLFRRGYVRRSVGQPSTEHNAAYGLLWWLNRPGRQRGPVDPVDAQGQPLTIVTGQQAPLAAANLFAAVGFGGQVMLADPGSKSAVVRLGFPPKAGGERYDFARAAEVLTHALR